MKLSIFVMDFRFSIFLTGKLKPKVVYWQIKLYRSLGRKVIFKLKKMRQLEFKQYLPYAVEEAWKFFSNPGNLSKITSKDMNFNITSKVQEKVYPGMIITYKVSPLFNIPMTWVTEITQVNELLYFVDEQRSGPYSIWHHEHHFESVKNGVMMTDKLFYKVPFGAFGNLLDRIFIYKKVCGIFEFRKKFLEANIGLCSTP